MISLEAHNFCTMENKVLTKKEIAESFTTGRFEDTFPYLAEGVTWNIVGDKELCGKSEVVSNCQATSEASNLVQKIFTQEQLIRDKNKIVIKGSGEFIRQGKRVNLIASCDVYEFNDNNEIETISSYCIAEKS
ncbi:MAG: hypothetical protein ACI857_000318 [Arenicella sp.]|jgi:hypothetical protein